ncbi:hypothetical protein EP7_004315 [Isosphaeraceae bacterium EP7]
MSNVEPCGWCRTPTAIFVDDLVWCQTPGCPHGGNVYPLDRWNRFQLAIVEARRKDFEAGRYFSHWIERRGGLEETPSWEEASKLDRPKFFNEELEEIDAFDDYIAMKY